MALSTNAARRDAELKIRTAAIGGELVKVETGKADGMTAYSLYITFPMDEGRVYAESQQAGSPSFRAHWFRVGGHETLDRITANPARFAASVRVVRYKFHEDRLKLRDLSGDVDKRAKYYQPTQLEFTKAKIRQQDTTKIRAELKRRIAELADAVRAYDAAYAEIIAICGDEPPYDLIYRYNNY